MHLHCIGLWNLMQFSKTKLLALFTHWAWCMINKKVGQMLNMILILFGALIKCILLTRNAFSLTANPVNCTVRCFGLIQTINLSFVHKNHLFWESSILDVVSCDSLKRTCSLESFLCESNNTSRTMFLTTIKNRFVRVIFLWIELHWSHCRFLTAEKNLYIRVICFRSCTTVVKHRMCLIH